MTSIEQSSDGLPDNLPLLTQVVDEDAPDDLPTLTEVVAEGQTDPATGIQPDANQEVSAPEAAIPAPCAPNEEEMQRLLQLLETHLEDVFTYKLSLNLEQLQRQAIEQAVSELKAELPELLRNALNAHHGL